MAARHSTAKCGAIPLELPLAKYVIWAYERNEEMYELPSPDAPYRSGMWEFVRFCMAHRELKGLASEEAFGKVSRVVNWESLEFDSEDSVADFLSTWEKVRVPAGDDFLVLAVSLAKEKPVILTQPISEGFHLLVSIAYHLQRQRLDNYINLPVERLSSVLGVSPRMVSRYVQIATGRGYVRRLAKAHVLSHQAAKYMFDFSGFDVETRREIEKQESTEFNKEVNDSDELEESKDVRGNRRVSEESERLQGQTGFLSESERTPRTLRVSCVPEIDSKKASAKTQAEFLQGRYRSGQ